MKQAAPLSYEKKETRRQLITVLLVLVLLASIGVYAFLAFYGSYIDGVLYAERLSQMREVTSQLFTNLEDIVNNQWAVAETQRNYVEDEHPANADALLDLMRRQARLNSFSYAQAELMAVDNTGRYYTQNGMQGTLAGMDHLSGDPERVSYVYNTLTSGKSEMVFLLRLASPLPMQVGDQTVTLTYYGISQDMHELNPYFSCEAYNGINSVYVLDETGSKLFSDSENSLLPGHNLFTVLNRMEYLHGSSFADAKQELSEHRIAYSNAVLNGQEYYYSLYQMENTAWTLLFLVPASSVASNTVALINTTVQLVLLFAVLLVAICAFMIYLLMRMKQKQLVNAERRNSEALMEINAELDRKNLALSNAVEQAEAATRQAEAASRAKTEFLANMSHDIRTPMNAIVGITNLMEHECNLTDRLNSYIQKIKFSSRHLLSLINDILDMSKIESTGVELNEEPVSLAEQIGQVDSIIRSQTNEHGQTFHISVHEIAHEYLVCDGVRLRQILLNLLSNAVKYTPNGGTILFDITELPCIRSGCAKYVFTVTDNGYGMEPEFLEHIFEPFTRAEHSVTNKVQGTGLGMTITKSIIDRMGGEIQVQSEPGRGSRFTVTLTLLLDPNAAYDLGAQHILLVSGDNTLIRNMRAVPAGGPAIQRRLHGGGSGRISGGKTRRHHSAGRSSARPDACRHRAADARERRACASDLLR